MSTSPNRTSGSAGLNIDDSHVANDFVQKSLAAFLVAPQRLMQINLEAASHAFSFMNRRMKAQAAMWSNVGNFSDTSGAAEAQRAFLETVTKDYAEEMTKLTDMARKNLASMAGSVVNGHMPDLPAARSS